MCAVAVNARAPRSWMGKAATATTSTDRKRRRAVIHVISSVESGGPLYPDERTLPTMTGSSEKGHERTHALQQRRGDFDGKNLVVPALSGIICLVCRSSRNLASDNVLGRAYKWLSAAVGLFG